MPPSHISVLVMLIAVFGGWIVKTRFYKTEYKESSIKTNVHLEEKDYGDVGTDMKIGIYYLDNVTESLGTIKTIHLSMGIQQKSLEEMIGEKLVTDNFHRLEFIHDVNTDEGQVFKQVFLESIPELMEKLEHGLTDEIWDLTETVIHDLHVYSTKLIGFGEHMQMGLQSAKHHNKFNNSEFEVTKKLVLVAGGVKCVYKEFEKINALMNKYVEWVGKGLGLKQNVISDTKKSLGKIFGLAYSAEKFADIFVNYVGVAIRSTKHSTWLEQERDEKMVPIVYEVVADKEESMKLEDLQNLFLAIGLEVDFDQIPNKMKDHHYRVVYNHRYPLPSSKGPFGALKVVS